MIVNAYAKINLDLYIKGKRADGYHELSTVMHALPLCDRVCVTLSDEEGVRVSCDREGVPCDARNSAHRAASAYLDAAGLRRGARISIEKRIPVEAGFGGSSTDGAAVLFSLERMLGALGKEKLFALAASLSADMPFCLSACKRGERGYKPYAALCGGVGDVMKEIPSVLEGTFVVVAKPDEGLSAKEMYARFDSAIHNECKTGAEFRGTVFYNDFQNIAETLRPNVSASLALMRVHGARAAILSGSGSGVFGVFTDLLAARGCADALSEKGFEAFALDLARRPEFVLFDLDGTLTRSAPGITNSVRYALTALGRAVPDDRTLEKFVGPPLVDSFMRYAGLSEEEAREALRLYRVYFSSKGIFENAPYDGVPEMLDTLAAHGKKIVLASSKPQEFVEKILAHFDLIRYFHYVRGATMDGCLSDKADVIARVLADLGADAGDAVMVGDRRFDVEGAHANGVYAIGVLYGYGGAEELAEAKADFFAATVADLTAALLE